MSEGAMKVGQLVELVNAIDNINKVLDIGTPETPPAVEAALKQLLTREELVKQFSIALMRLRMAKSVLEFNNVTVGVGKAGK